MMHLQRHSARLILKRRVASRLPLALELRQFAVEVDARLVQIVDSAVAAALPPSPGDVLDDLAEMKVELPILDHVQRLVSAAVDVVGWRLPVFASQLIALR